MIKHHTYVSADSRDGVVKSLEEALIKLIKWFSDRLMKVMLPSVVYYLTKTTQSIEE